MVFVGRPRQFGKTSPGQAIFTDAGAWLNFDIAAHRAAILRRELPATGDLFFDEIHKFRGWRDYL